ncbi:cysteine hydrolase [Mycoplasma phocoeninasale]|uniref:Cysteine hydrolase n=2 Tax=Mycoplasma phocoeninasale TaxID=2726117 RepID=A0A858U2Q5_9MOLU|nr:cysteine hydrolase [Mycoplasma phocoeninasale]QJG66692.1 cysteine hydrolase [Mycoplasma phocoeninasale]
MKKIILVVDMLNGFCKKGALFDKNIAKIIPRIQNFLATNSDVDNIFFCDAHSEDDLEMKNYPLHCLNESYESEIVDELKQYCKKRINKNSTNSFFKVDSEIINNYQSFEIVGCCTDICILELALTLRAYLNNMKINKDVIVYKNLVDTFHSKNHPRSKFHKFALKIMKNAGIVIK